MNNDNIIEMHSSIEKLAARSGHFMLWMLLLVLSPSVFAVSPQVVDVGETFEYLYIGDKLVYKEADEMESYQSAAKSLLSKPAQWAVVKEDTFTAKVMKSHWFAFRISSGSSKNSRLIVNYDYAWLWDFTLYVIDDKARLVRSHTSGHRYTFSNRPIPTRTFNMPVLIPPDKNYFILIKAEGRTKPVYDRLNLYEEATFYHHFEGAERGLWLYYGVMVVMALYNLMLFASIREAIYLSFSLFVLAIMGLYFAVNGHAFELLWPNSPWFNERSTILFALLVMIANVDFYRRLLDVRSQLPRFNIYTYVLQVVSLLLIIYIFLIPPREDMSSVKILSVALISFFVLSFANSLYLQFWRKMREAKYYNLSFGVFCVMSIVYILQDAGYISANVVTLYGVNIGQVIMVVILSLALADRINTLKNERQCAEAESFAKSEILAKMSHEIRTPMNGVLGMSEILSTTELTAKQRNYNDAIYSSGSTLLGIINDILDFSKIEAGKMELATDIFDLEKRALETLEMFRHKASEKKLQLMLHYDPLMPRKFYGDPVRIQQIIINYLGNALKFTETGEVILRIFSLSSSRIRIEVLDTGIGIDEANLSKLFHSFSQADSRVAKNYGGTGLGLAICKQLAELMEGEVGVESSPGKGALFFAELELEGAETHVPEGEEKDQFLARKHALIVDENHTYASCTLKQLQAWGMTADIACSGTDALKILHAAQARDVLYDVISVDLQMQDGEALAEKIHAEAYWKKTALLLLSAVQDKQGIQKNVDAGLIFNALKPLQVQALYPLYCELCGFCVLEKEKRVVRTGGAVFSGHEMNVLVVEDNPVNQQVLSAMLTHLGVNLVIATDGLKAVECYTASLESPDESFALILMDCEMPEMDGYEATEKIRELEKRQGKDAVTIYALTAHAVQKYLDRCYQVGMNGYITKPVKIDTLKKLLEKCNKKPAANKA